MKRELERLRREVEELKGLKTKCRQLEETLREKNEWFFRIFHASSNPMSIVTIKEDRFIDVNEAFSRLSQFGREELIGHRVDEFSLFVDPEQKNLIFREVGETGRAPAFELPVLTKAGERLTLLFSADLINVDGEPCILSAAVDITAQRRETDALRRSEERYRTLIENSLQGLTIIQDDRFVFCNAAFARMTGFSVEEVLSIAPRELEAKFLPNDRALLEGRRQDRAAGKPVKSRYEFRGIKKDGTGIWMEAYSNLIEYNGMPALQTVLVDITERKLAEASAMETREQLLLALEAAGMATWDLNNQTGDVIEDEGWIIGMGYEPGEIKPNLQSLNALIHPDDLKELERAARDHLEGKTDTYSAEYRIRTKSEGWIWILDRGRIISRDSSGKPMRTTGVHFNITDRKRTEETLRRVNRELKAISDCNQILIRAEDEQTLLLDICQIICEKAGYQMAWVGYAENDEAKSIRPVAWAGFEDGYLSVSNNTWADTEPGRGPIGTAIRQGSCIYVQDYATDPAIIPWREMALERGYNSSIALPLKDEKANVFGVLGIYSAEAEAFTLDEIRLMEELAGDLAFGISTLRVRAERKRTEEALEESREYLNHIINSIGDQIFVIDRNHEFVLVNDASCAFTGNRREELIGRSGNDFLTKEQAKSIWEFDERIFQSGKECISEDTIADGQGNLRTLMTRKSIFADKRGNKQLISVLRDITEYKRLQAQFLQAQKMESIGILAGGIAHDFNNLLNVINGYSELLTEEINQSRPERESVDRIKEAGQRATQLTSQLLAFSRKQILQPEILDLNTVISQMSSMLRRLIGENIEIVSIAQPDLGSVNADPAQIQQVLMNLAVNARDAMPQGGKLTIETSNIYFDDDYVREHPLTKTGYYVMLAISDNGTGMDAATKARLFEPFFTSKAKGKGTGLGLSTVYGIVKQSNGFIWVYSEPGEGTTFKIYFPRTEGQTRRVPAERLAAPSINGTETLLVVEDDAALRALTNRILQQYGYSILEASNGIDALDIAMRYAGTIHLVITDVVMPEMGGKDLISKLKAIRPDVKALYVSGYTDNAIVHHGILDSDVAFLQKPFTVEKLLRKAREVLDS